MGLAISKDYTGFTISAVGSTVSSCTGGSQAANAADCEGAAAGEADDTVELSTAGRLAGSALLSGLMLPTEENVRKLSTTLSNDLGSLLSGSGISAQPPIEFNVSASGEIQVRGDRADKQQILDAVNGDEKVKEEIGNTAAIASQTAAQADSLKFETEYVGSKDPESVVAKYSYLFGSGQMSHNISLQFDGTGVDVLSDGKTWLSSGT